MGIELFSAEDREAIADTSGQEATDDLLERFLASAQEQAAERLAERQANHARAMDDHQRALLRHADDQAAADRRHGIAMAEYARAMEIHTLLHADYEKKRDLLKIMPVEWRDSVPPIGDEPVAPEEPVAEVIDAPPEPVAPEPETDEQAVATLMENLKAGLARRRQRALDAVPDLATQMAAMQARIAELERAAQGKE